MKKFLILCLGIVSCLLFTSCSNKKSGQTIDPDFPKLEDTRSKEYKENTITTLNGDDVTYNMNTRKIVCLFGSQDVVAFGIELLAYEGSTDISGYESLYGKAKQLKNSQPFSAEEVLSYEPELILVNEKMTSANIETLSDIAPVIPLKTESTDFSVRLTLIGEIFGLEESAEKLIKYSTDLKDKMLNKLNEIGVGDKTLTIYTYMGGISIVPERGWFMNVIIYDYLGVNRLDNVKEFMQNESGMAYTPISSEDLGKYEGDLVMFAGFDGATISTYVTENVGWKRLNAVKENRVGVIDITPYGQKGVILLYYQYYQIVEALKTAMGK